jgi:rubrerythrin
MKIEAAVRPLAELERSLAELYGSWAEAFEGGDREAAFVFFRMSSEEKGHAALIDYAKRFVQKDPKLGGEIDIDLSLIQGAINKVRVIRETGAIPSVHRAVEIALDLEASAAESHYLNALKQMNPEMERLLKCLGGEDQQHLGRLKEFAARRGFPARPAAKT